MRRPILPVTTGVAKLVPIMPIISLPDFVEIKGLLGEPPNSSKSGLILAPSRPGPIQL